VAAKIAHPDLPILVNRQRPVGADYVPDDLSLMTDVCPPDVVKIKYPELQADATATQALVEMLRGGMAYGLGDWQISDAYRSYADQKRLFDDKVNGYIQNDSFSRDRAISAATKTVSPPGSSEHHTGLAFDITVPGRSFAGTKQAEWLAQHCQEYGFILRYQTHKEALTGYIAEAWHFRYVGVEAAETMTELDWCLEEYMQYFESF
jgi:D-alanyl-D-alanine carboxypeptidase